VLSAFRTALGRPESGEGVLGLVSGFQMAGARDVVASLWDVDDEATRLRMERFYEGLLSTEEPLGTAEALRRAARAVRDTPRSAAPRYGAAFVAYVRGGG
jgi:CHAT domain-containing protein